MNTPLSTLLAILACFLCFSAAGAVPAVTISDQDIGGEVKSPNGPEAGVWVIAETRDLPTRYAKIVVTDDQGRFVIPELPKAHYQVWVRGYGLVDSLKVSALPGQILELRALLAPNKKAAAAYYPGVYWYSMLEIPKSNEFPGTGAQGNGIPSTMKSQYYWVDTLKNGCQSCHALGSRGVREIPGFFMDMAHGNSMTAWTYRTQAGQAMGYMAAVLARLGPEKGLELFSHWTDRIAQGAVPSEEPPRPRGLERNAVYTLWDWSSSKHYLHDAISTDKRQPTVNANGLIWGAPEESTDLVPTLDPIHHVASNIRMPFRDPATPSQLDVGKGPSAYWGDELIWDGHTSIHNLIMDEWGRVWFSARIRPASNPSFCRRGSQHPSAQVLPLDESLRQISLYDPEKKSWQLIDTCFSTHHLYFGHDHDETLWTSAGSPTSGVVGWLNTRLYLESGDEQKAQGWTPLIIDTNGNGRRDDYVEAGQALDPKKDKRVMAAFYGVQPSPVDDAIWGQSMDVGFSRLDQPGYLIRLNPGSDPAQTALAEIFQPPEGTFGPRGLDIDSKGVVWTVLSSGQMASFDRSKCKGPLNGPTTAEGKQCPEGWSLYRFPGPQFTGLDPKGSADHAYYIWVDRFNTLGLGKDVPIASTNGGESLLALTNGQLVNLHVPYPMPFFTKNVDGRIDDPGAGWKGRGLWTTSGSRANFHGEDRKEASPMVFKIQIRPNPLDH